MIAIGVSEEGHREILDMEIFHEESTATYERFFDGLKERGVGKVDLIISDGHKGIKKAASRSFIGSSWQLCSVHFKRNIMKIVPKKAIKSVMTYINDILRTKDVQEAHQLAHEMIATYEDTYPKLAKFLEDNLADVMTFLSFHERHHRKIHSTNVLERFNREVKTKNQSCWCFS
jgi:transposase-like protein